MQNEEKPDPPTGTLAAALAVIDADIAEHNRYGKDAPHYEMIAAAWSTVRRAALKSLEPAAEPEVDPGSMTLRAHRLSKAAQDRISLLVGDPSPDSEAAIRVANLAIAPAMAAMLIEAIEQISDRIALVGETINFSSRCGSVYRSLQGESDGLRCIRRSGHCEPHEDVNGDCWS